MTAQSFTPYDRARKLVDNIEAALHEPAGTGTRIDIEDGDWEIICAALSRYAKAQPSESRQNNGPAAAADRQPGSVGATPAEGSADVNVGSIPTGSAKQSHDKKVCPLCHVPALFTCGEPLCPQTRHPDKKPGMRLGYELVESARTNADYWLNAGRNEPKRDEAVIAIEQAVNAYKNIAYALAERVKELSAPSSTVAPVDPESEAANPVWDLVIQTCAQAWPAGLLTWNQSPTELIVRIIDERDEARAALSARVALLESQLATEIKNKKEFERDWLEACEQIEALPTALSEIAAERKRQIEKEGWTHEHDDEHDAGTLACAGAAYALNAGCVLYPHNGTPLEKAPEFWMWDERWWKPKNPRRDLIRAAALIVAELERLERSLYVEERR